MAKATGLELGEFVHTIGDAHIYLNHIDPLKEQVSLESAFWLCFILTCTDLLISQLKREPRPFPVLKIKRNVDKLEDLQFDDFELIGT